MNTDWNEVFKRRPDLAPPGYEEACLAGKAASAERYKKNGFKRAKGSNARKPLRESRQAADARRTRFPSIKHSQQN